MDAASSIGLHMSVSLALERFATFDMRPHAWAIEVQRSSVVGNLVAYASPPVPTKKVGWPSCHARRRRRCWRRRSVGAKRTTNCSDKSSLWRVSVRPACLDLQAPEVGVGAHWRAVGHAKCSVLLQFESCAGGQRVLCRPQALRRALAEAFGERTATASDSWLIRPLRTMVGSVGEGGHAPARLHVRPGGLASLDHRAQINPLGYSTC